MPNTKIYSETKSHYDPDGNPATGNATGRGTDSHHFQIPEGQKYSHSELAFLDATMGSTCSKSREPQIGVTGAQEVAVEWSYNLLGKIRYRLDVFAIDEGEQAPPIPVTVIVGEQNWQGKAKQAIDEHRGLKLIFKGIETGVFVRLWGLQPNTVVPIAASSIGLLLLAAIAITCVLIGFVLLYAINKGCNAKVKFKIGGPLPIDDELEFDIQCR